VDLAGRTVRLLIRVARVGRVPLLLLDSNVPENEASDREVTGRLYGGGSEMRLQQEIVLGIGGSRALDKTGLTPTIRHINEGHAAFVSLEKIRKLVQEGGLTFAEAREVATTGNVFTTHTPVPAGIDVFTPDLLWKYFGGYVGELGVSFDQFFDVGREVGGEKRELFSMAVLAMRLSTHQNAVSQLHAKVSRRLWRDVHAHVSQPDHPVVDAAALNAAQKTMRRQTHEAIAKVSDDFGRRLSFNTAIAACMELLNALGKFDDASDQGRAVRHEALEAMVLLLNPVTPHIAHALWQVLGHGETLIEDQAWPKVDVTALTKDVITLAVQVNGKLRGTIDVPVSLAKDAIERLALAEPKVADFLAGQTPKKIIVVPGKIVNIVV